MSRRIPNLGMPVSVGWYGIRGMGWSEFIHEAQLRVVYQRPPSVILVHLGGNDLSKLTTLSMMAIIRKGLKYVRRAAPECHLVWVDILPRFDYRVLESAWESIDQKRMRVNRFGHAMMTKLHGHVLSPDIDLETPGFFRPDGVHLSDVGNDMYIDALRDCIRSLIRC